MEDIFGFEDELSALSGYLYLFKDILLGLLQTCLRKEKSLRI